MDADWLKEKDCDFQNTASTDGYKSPIEMLTENLQYELDRAACKALLTLKIEVDPYELRQALLYDRNQYNKGFSAGFQKGRAASRKTAWWQDEGEGFYCTECGTKAKKICTDAVTGADLTPYCSECGAAMNGVLGGPHK